MKFIKVKDNRTGIEYDWMADIQSIPDLMAIEETFASRNAHDIIDYLQSKDYCNLVNNTFVGSPLNRDHYTDHCHPKNKPHSFLNACVLAFPENKKIHPILHFTEKLGDAAKGKVASLEKYGRILININGGYFSWHDKLTELASTVSDRFPQYELKDIKVSKWPEGTHWYITVNGCAVNVDGIEKWKKEADAWDAAKRWLKNEKITN